jgi:L-lactate utilization protein LutB
MALLAAVTGTFIVQMIDGRPVRIVPPAIETLRTSTRE